MRQSSKIASMQSSERPLPAILKQNHRSLWHTQLKHPHKVFPSSNNQQIQDTINQLLWHTQWIQDTINRMQSIFNAQQSWKSCEQKRCWLDLLGTEGIGDAINNQISIILRLEALVYTNWRCDWYPILNIAVWSTLAEALV